jgi:TP901 family phage tail tape measure protein
MPSSATYELAILLSLRDAASTGLDRFEDRLRATGKEGRELLKTVQDLRKDISQGLGQAGAGLTILAGIKKGIDEAGAYEEAILDLRSAYQESARAGSLSASEQASQLNKLDALAVRLGNRLQGNTSNYVGILTALKQAGVETEVVISGAGESAANLANVSGAIRRGMEREQAKELGQFGKLFALRGEDFAPSVDLFAALKDRFDIESGDLIESAKYFKSTAATLGMTGLTGASDTSKFFALVKRFGALEGSQAGTSATSFFQQFTAHADKLKDLKKEKGIDIQLFDAKGNFKGWENAFREMEKFRKLTGQKRLEALNDIFGEQGGKVAGVMVEAGAAGWANVAAEAQKAVPVNEKINQQMETYNAKWEALGGTWTNIKATVFTPMLDVLKPILDLTNSVLGSFQEWVKTHPDIARIVTTTGGLVGILLTVTGGIRAATAAWNLYKIASTAALGGAQAQTSGLVAKLTSLPKTIQIGLVLGAAWFTVEKVIAWLEANKQEQEMERNLQAAGNTSVENLTKLKEAYAKEGQSVPQDVWSSRAKTTLKAIDLEGTLDQSLRGGVGQGLKKFFQLVPFTPEKYPFYGVSDKDRAGLIKERAGELAVPELMAAFRKEIQGKGWSSAETAPLEKALAIAFPESFQKSSELLGQQFSQLSAGMQESLGSWKIMTDEFTAISQPMKDTSTGLSAMVRPSNELPGAFTRMGNAAENFANRVNNLDLSTSITWQPPLPGSLAPSQQPAPLPGPRLTTPPLVPLLGPRRQASYTVDETKTGHGTAGSSAQDFRLTVAPAALQQLSGLHPQPQAPFIPAHPEGERLSPFPAGLESLRAPSRAEPTYTVSVVQPPTPAARVAPESAGAPAVMASLPPGFLVKLESLRVPSATPTSPTILPQTRAAGSEQGAPRSSGLVVSTQPPSDFLAELESLRAPGGIEKGADAAGASPVVASLQSVSMPLPAEVMRASLGGGRTRSVHVGSININLPAGSQAAKDPRALASLLKGQLEELAVSDEKDDAWFVSKLHQHSSEIERVYVRFKGSGRERAGHG